MMRDEGNAGIDTGAETNLWQTKLDGEEVYSALRGIAVGKVMLKDFFHSGKEKRQKCAR